MAMRKVASIMRMKNSLTCIINSNESNIHRASSSSSFSSSWGMMMIRNACNCCTDPPSNFVDLSMKDYDPYVFTFPDFKKYYRQLKSTLGFGIDIDLGDYPKIIRPYNGSLDDPEVTLRARFAVDQYNNSKDVNIQFEKVVKANRLGTDKYFLIFEGFDGSDCKKKRYRAIVDGDPQKNNIELKRFDLYGNADEPLVLYHTNEDDRIFPRDYLKYKRQVWDSKAYDVDDNLDLGAWEKLVFPFDGSLDDPRVMDPAQFALKEYNRHQKTLVQFVRVVKATHQRIDNWFIYYLTSEVDDSGEKKTFKAGILLKEGNKKKLLQYYLINNSGTVINKFIRSLRVRSIVD